GRAGPDERVQLVNEDDVLRVLDQLAHDLFESLLELPAVLRACDDERQVEREYPLVLKERGHVAADDSLRESFNDGGLADARLADEHGVVLRPAAEYLDDSLYLALATNERVEFVVGGVVRQVARELGEVRRLLLLRGARVVARLSRDLLAHCVQTQAALVENLGGHRALFAKESEQEVFRPDVSVLEAVALLVRVCENAFRFGRERQFDRGGNLLAQGRAPLYLLAYGFERGLRAREEARRQRLVLAHEAQKQVLRLDCGRAELRGLVPREEYDPPRLLRVSLKHKKITDRPIRTLPLWRPSAPRKSGSRVRRRI